jgi:hypothetical protein
MNRLLANIKSAPTRSPEPLLSITSPTCVHVFKFLFSSVIELIGSSNGCFSYSKARTSTDKAGSQMQVTSQTNLGSSMRALKITWCSAVVMHVKRRLFSTNRDALAKWQGRMWISCSYRDFTNQIKQMR